MLTHCQKSTPKSFSQELLLICCYFYDPYFRTRATNKMTLIWVSFHLVVTIPLEKSVFKAFSNFNIISLKSLPQK